MLVVGMLNRSVLSIPSEIWYKVDRRYREGNVANTEDIPEGLLEDLRQASILVDEDLDEKSYVRARSFVSRASRETFGLIVVPTMACNMGCHYCFESKPESDGGISPAVESRISEFVLEKLHDPLTKVFHLRWFGGEPTLEIDKVVRITEMVRNLCFIEEKRFQADIITNGFSLDRQQAMRLKESGVSAAQVTFEGDRRKHDKIRRTKSMGSYDTIVNNILESSDIIEFSGRVHVAPYSINTIPQLLNDLKEKGVDRLLKSIYFAPLFNYKQGQDSRQFSSGDPLYLSSKDFSEHEISLLKTAKGLGFSILDPLDVDYGVCTALRENTAVMNTDGSLTKCYLDAGDEAEIFGSIVDPKTKDNNIAKWRDADFSQDAVCSECTFSPVCLGGCTKHASSTSSKEMICTSLKFNYEKTIPLFYGET